MNEDENDMKNNEMQIKGTVTMKVVGSTSLQAPWRVVNVGWFQLTGLPWIPPCYA